MLAHDDVLRVGDLYEVLKGYPSSLEVRYMIEEALKASPHGFSSSSPLSSDESVKISSLCTDEKGNAPQTTSSRPDLSLLPLSSTKEPQSILSHELEQTEWLNLLLQSKVEEEVRRLAKTSPHLFRTSLPSLGGRCPVSRPPLAPNTTKSSREISEGLSSCCYTAEKVPCMTTSTAMSSFSANFSAEQWSTSHANDNTVAPFSTRSHSVPVSSTGKNTDITVCHVASVSTQTNENQPDSRPSEVSPEKPVSSNTENQIHSLMSSLQELRERIEKSERDFSTLMTSLLSISSLNTKKDKKWTKIKKSHPCTRRMHHCAFTDMSSEGSSNSKPTEEQRVAQTEIQGNDFFYYQLPPPSSLCSSYTMPRPESTSWPVYFVSSISSGDPSALLQSVPHDADSTSSEHHSIFTTTGVMGPPPLWRLALDRQDVPTLRQQLAMTLIPHSDRSDMNEVTQKNGEVFEREKKKRNIEKDIKEEEFREKRVSQQTLRSSFEGSSLLRTCHSSPPTTIRSYLGRRSKWDSTEKDQKQLKEHRREHHFSIGANKENKYRDSGRTLLSSVSSSSAVKNKKRIVTNRLGRKDKQEPEVRISIKPFFHSPEAQTVAKPIKQSGNETDSQKSSSGAVPSALLPLLLTPSSFLNCESASNLPFSAQNFLVDSSGKTNLDESTSTPTTLPFEEEILANKIYSLSSERVLGINAVDVPPGFLDRCLIPLQCLEDDRKENRAQGLCADSTTDTMANGETIIADRTWEGQRKECAIRTAKKKCALSDATCEMRWRECDEPFPYQNDDGGATQQEKNPTNGGVRVVKVDKGSVAERAGLRPGDVVLEMAPFGPVQSCMMLVQILQRYRKRQLEHSHIHPASLPKNEEKSHFLSLFPPEEMVALVYRPLVPRLLHIPLRW